ncbi:MULTISPECIES: hypothetical protein [Cyanophyceae]|nr:hypothetical protein [Phormidium sp. FACHB-592]
MSAEPFVKGQIPFKHNRSRLFFSITAKRTNWKTDRSQHSSVIRL